MDDKSSVTAALGKSADVDAVLGVEIEGDKVSVTGWNCGFSISIGSLVTTTVNSELVESEDVDVVLGVETEEDKLSVKGWIAGLAVSIGALIKYISSSVLSTDIGP